MDTAKDIAVITGPTVIYEDEAVLVVDKPTGWLVHGDGRDNSAPTIVDWFLERCPTAQGVGEETVTQTGVPLERSGVVHRLDRDTSGVLILAKHAVAYSHLKAQFHDQLAHKEYRAITYGVIARSTMTIDRPIGRSARDFRLRSAERGARGRLREAVTEVRLLAAGEFQGEKFSAVALAPQTGRTHQLRVHLKAIDRPIVGDTLYAGKRLVASNNLGLERLALHAHILDITLPNGQLEHFVAPLPAPLATALEHIAE